MYKHSKQVKYSGIPLNEAEKAIIMVHGRGATSESIISLAEHLNLSDASLLAPVATNRSWYPYSFMAPVEKNQPALDTALELIDLIVKDVLEAGIPLNKIYFLGFSQGACLMLEYITQNAAPYGGAITFTGALIGEHINPENYKGDFANTPILVTTGDPDSHVPLYRVEESIAILKELHADVFLKVYKDRPHTILNEEIELANQLVLK